MVCVLPEEGSTGVYPTIKTPNKKVLTNALQSTAKCKNKESKEAFLLGIHNEVSMYKNNKSIDSSVEDYGVKLKKTGQYAVPNMKMNEQLCLLVEEALVPCHSCIINSTTYLGIINYKGRLCA